MKITSGQMSVCMRVGACVCVCVCVCECVGVCVRVHAGACIHTKHIAKKNRIESMCLRYLKDGFIHTTWELGYMAFATATQRKEDWRPRQTSKERESSVACL